MKLTIPFPLLARIRPANERKRDWQYFYGSRSHSADVVEVSRSETEDVIDTVRTVSEDAPAVYPPMRAFDGKLYREVRPLALNAPAFVEGLASSGFAGPVGRSAMSNPVSRPVFDLGRWHVALSGIATTRNFKLWPNRHVPRQGLGGSVYYTTPRLGERGDFRFAEMGDEFREVMAADIERHDLSCGRQMESLLFIDGVPWIETLPPCYEIKIGAHHAKSRFAALGYGHVPQVADQDLYTIRFQLTEMAEAMELLGVLRGSGVSTSVDPVEVGGFEPAFTSFDSARVELEGLALSLAGNLARKHEQHSFHGNYKDAGPLFDAEDEATFQTVKEALYASDRIIGADQLSSLVDMLPDIERLGNIARPAEYSGLTRIPPSLLPMLLERATMNVAVSIEAATMRF